MIIVNKLLLHFRNLPNIFDKKFSPFSNEQTRSWINEDSMIVSQREKCLKSFEAFENAAKLMETIL